MSKTLKTRLEKLEAVAHPQRRVVVVDGYSDEEHEAKIEALKASGAATDRDLFVCITQFSDHPYKESEV